jgi:hypothetical protein
MKKCTKCSRTKRDTSFYKKSSTKDGLTFQCKDCLKDYSKDYIKRTLTERLAYQKQYRKSNKEKVQQNARKYYSENIEQHQQKDKRYRLRHPDKLRLKGQIYRKENRDYFLNKTRERKMKLLGVSDGSITPEFEAELFALQNGRCAYCRKSIKKKKHLDHILAISNDGLHTRFNVHWTCPSCNISKFNLLESVWLQKRGIDPSTVWRYPKQLNSFHQ